MRNLIRALAFLAMLPGVAAAQCSSTVPLPINTVLGRLGITPGPCQAIPFNQLAQTLFTNANLTLAGATGKVFGGSPGAFTATPTLGVPSTTTGTLTLANIGNAGTVTIGAASTATTWTFKFPTTAGSNGQSLITDGSGNTSWAAGTGTVNSGTAGQLTYYATTAAAVSGNANLTVSAGALTIGVAGSQAGTLLLAGGTSGATTLAGPASGGGTMTFPAGSDTVMSIAATQTVTNKTLTSPAINTPTITAGTLTALTGLAIRDTSAAFDLTLTATSTSAALTAGRALTLDMGNVAHTVQFGTTANTITFPNVASDTVAMLAAAQSISGKTFTTSTYNGNTWTAGTGTLTIAAGKTLTASNSLTFTGTDGNSFAFPSGSDTVVTLAASQTLTNKTFTAPTINGGTAQALTNLGVRSSGGGAFDMVVNNTETLTAQRALTVTLNNAARAVNLSGDLVTAAGFSTAGSGAIVLTATGGTNVTLPTSGTLAAINIAQTFSSANVFSATQQFSNIKLSAGMIFPTTDSTTALQITKADGTTRVMDFDTTNARVGINKTPGAFDLDVNGAVNVGSTVTFTTLDPTSLASSTSTVTGLTANNSPNSSNDYIPYYSAADGKIRKATVGSIAAGATAGVSSANGLTGGLTITATGATNVASSGTTITMATPDYFFAQNCTLSASVASNILTVALKDNAGADPSSTSPCRIPFRSSTAATGTTTVDSVTSALSINTNATGATLGVANNVAFRLWVVAFDNSGTAVMALFNASTASQCFPLVEGLVASSTAFSGSASSANVFYTPNGTTVTSKPFRILGYVEYNSTGLVTAGTYATGPNFIQTFGPGIKRPCEPVQSIYALISGTTPTTSTSFVDSALTASITPTSAANFVSMRASGVHSIGGSAEIGITQARRDSTDIGTNGQFGTAANAISTGSWLLWDKPNKTSSTTYLIRVKSNSGATVSLPAIANSSSEELVEIMG